LDERALIRQRLGGGEGEREGYGNGVATHDVKALHGFDPPGGVTTRVRASWPARPYHAGS
jgi:hypothetical protein